MSAGRLVANYGKVVMYTRGGSVAEWSWRRTRNPVVLGSSLALKTTLELILTLELDLFLSCPHFKPSRSRLIETEGHLVLLPTSCCVKYTFFFKLLVWTACNLAKSVKCTSKKQSLHN